MTETVSVVILTWNDGELLDRAVESVGGAERPVEIIVVDNGSDPPATIDAPRARVIREERNLGVAAGRNVGARAASGEIVCFLDSDAELMEGSLDRLTDHLLADPTVGLVAPVFEGQLAEASAGVAPTLGRKVARALGRTEGYGSVAREPEATVWDVDFAIGACQVFRREAFDQVDGLDESYFYGPEDADFCMRLKLAGWRVVQVNDAPVHHPARRRNRKLLTRRGLRHGWAVTRFLWRHRRFRSRTT